MKYLCPCCKRKTLSAENERGEICPVCFWENDPLQQADPHYSGGANSVSLLQARKNVKHFGVCERRFINQKT